MASETIVDSLIAPGTKYKFEDDLLDKDDSGIESDVHKITIFGSDYSIAMGKMRKSSEDSDVIYFVAYLVYETKVVSKIGVYEKAVPATEQDVVSHRNFDFGSSDIILLDKYYNNRDLLKPFQRSKVDNEISTIKLGENIEFVNDRARASKLLSELQQLVEPVSPEDNLDTSKFYYKYLNGLRKCLKVDAAADSIRKYIISKGKVFIVKDGKIVASNLFTILKDDKLKLTLPTLLCLEIAAQIKFIVVDGEQDRVKFSITGGIKPDCLSTSLKNDNKYGSYNPENIAFVRKSEGDEYELLSYNGGAKTNINSIDISLLGMIKTAFEDDEHEYKQPGQLSHLKSAFDGLDNEAEAEADDVEQTEVPDEQGEDAAETEEAKETADEDEDEDEEQEQEQDAAEMDEDVEEETPGLNRDSALRGFKLSNITKDKLSSE